MSMAPDNITATPQSINPCSLDPKWWYFLISSGCSLVGGIILILIIRGIKLLITQVICPSEDEDGNRGEEVHKAVMGYLMLKRSCEELVASQNITGKILAGLHVICSIGSFIIYIIDADDEDNLENCTHWLSDPMQIVDSAFNLYFLFHFIVRFMGNRDKLLAWVSILSLIDHFTVPPMIVAMVIQRNWLGLRFLRAFGLIGLSNMLQAWNLIRNKTSIRLAQLLSLFMAIWLAGAGVMHLIEGIGNFWHPTDPQIQKEPYWVWVYFLMVTMSTVGYGDYSAQTTPGRIFVVIYIMTALGFFASCIPEIVESISDKRSMLWRGSYKRQYGEKTVVVCGHLTKDTVKTFLKDFLHKDRVVDKHLKVIFLGVKEPDIEMEALLKHYILSVIYFQGTVMNINDLERIRIKEAVACLILTNKHCSDPEQEDASAIMKVIAIKDYDPEVRIVVQLLNYQNKGHLLTIPNWNPSRGDKVVCLSELKLGFMAQNCLAPGFSTLLANLFTLTSYKEKRHKKKLTWQEHYKRSAAFEMYTSKFSEAFHGLTFKQAAELIYRKLDLLLMAIDVLPDEFGNRSVMINPTDDYCIDCNTDGFFIAQDEAEVRRVLYYCTRCHKDTYKIKLSPCRCARSGMAHKKSNDFLKDTSLLFDPEKGSGIHISSNAFTDIDQHDGPYIGDMNKNTNDGFMNTEPNRHILGSTDSINSDQLDTTGLFYWCPDHDMEEVVLTYQQANSRHFSNHVVVCLFAESDSPLIGLCSFILPLRASNIRANDIKPILIIGNLEYLQREWTNIMNFPQVYILTTSYVPSLTKTIHIGNSNSQGSALSRAYLRAANIFECAMCVVLTARKNLTDELCLADKEAILCTLNIKTMPQDIMVNRTAYGLDGPGERILTITELANDYNVQYLEQDDDTDDVEIFMAQPYACGRVFTSTLLDSLMSTTYHNQNALAFIRALVTGGVTTQVEQIYAEGFGLISGDRVNSLGRNRTRVSQMDFDDERFRQFRSGCCFEELWLYAIRTFGIIVIGLYRLLYPDQPNAFKRYVITFPSKEMMVLPSDKVFLLEPFVQSKKSHIEVEEQTTVL